MPPELCPDETTPPTVSEPKTVAAGATAVAKSMAHVWGLAGVVRGTRALAMLNQKGGIDCPSCAWPDPDGHRTFTEFCENGAKAIAWEADTRRLNAEFFRTHSLEKLAKQSDYWHGQQGRLTEPLYLPPGGTHYQPIAWDDAFAIIGQELRALPSPDDAYFYTSGRASNEAAFLYQLFARRFGTNNLPDCSNMCHESSGSALGPTLGIGKGTVKLEDFAKAELILILGQNPGTNHPRMLTALQEAKRAGAKIVAVNPLKEAGLLAFNNPQEARGMLGMATSLADLYLQVKIGTDQALLQAAMKALVERNAIDRDFIAAQTDGFDELAKQLQTRNIEPLLAACGIERPAFDAFVDLLAKSGRIIACWAMGLTQHKHAVATIQDLVNLLLLRGSIGKPGAGACPVRGHSNVQGDRTMGIYEQPPAWFLDALQQEFHFDPPREHGADTVEAIRRMHAKPGQVFFALGGNFLSATPDTSFTAQALRNCKLTVHVSIKLNRSHLVPGRAAMILPCLGRTERDDRHGPPQFVTTENSMGVVQQSAGTLAPASSQLLSEPEIVARLAEATLGEASGIPWRALAQNYDRIRDRIERVIPGFTDYNRRARAPGGFYLPNEPRDGKYPTATGKARFTTHAVPSFDVDTGQLVMMTIRTHDQFNTTIYGLHDRYRGLHDARRVILMHADDLSARGLASGDRLTITSHFRGETRTAAHFTAVAYDIPRGNCATYFPETNVLVPLESVADVSQTPTSKWVVVTVAKETP